MNKKPSQKTRRDNTGCPPPICSEVRWVRSKWPHPKFPKEMKLHLLPDVIWLRYHGQAVTGWAKSPPNDKGDVKESLTTRTGDARPSLGAAPGSEAGKRQTERAGETATMTTVPRTCPKCGAQTRDPFRGTIVIHDIYRCRGLSQNVKRRKG
jgi:hypothetical protein